MDPSLYSPVFLHLAVILSIVLALTPKTDELSLGDAERNDVPAVALLSLLLIFWLGLRPASYVFGDTGNYARTFRLFSPEVISDKKEWAFYRLMAYAKSSGLSVNIFFLWVEIVYIGGVAWACLRGFGKERALLPFIVSMASFSFYTYAVNGLRQGMACSMMLAVLALFKGKPQWLLIVPIAFLAVHVHSSTYLLAGAALLAYCYRDTRIYLIAWGVCLLLGMVASGMTESIFSNVGLLDTGKDNSYYNNDSVDLSQFSRTGFRFDFMLYGSVPILVGAYYVLKEKFNDPWYTFILNVYLIANSFWALVNQSWLSNRVAYLSWCSYGLVLTYPFVMAPYVEDRKKKITYVLLGNAAFSYVMWIIGKYM